MIRLLLLIVALLLIWLLFFSQFARKLRLGLSAVLVALLVLALWIESSNKTARTGLIAADQIGICGVRGEFSYRTNYNIDACLLNQHESATARRVQIRFSALLCEQGDCRELENVTRTFTVDLPPQTRQETAANLSFPALEESMQGLTWSAEVEEVWGVR